MHVIDQYLAPFASRRFQAQGEDSSISTLCPSLQPLYQDFNGGYFWNGALLIRPAQRQKDAPLTIFEWNDVRLWKNQYEDVCKDVTFFAEDAFGAQFGIEGNRIIQFDPETAVFTSVAETLDDWCQELVRDPDFYTGAPVLAAWERKNQPIKVGQRLVPKQLFMLGGDFHSDNMVCKSDVEGLSIRSQFWKMTKDLPDGQKIVFRSKE